MRRTWPVVLTLLISLGYVTYRLSGKGWDAAALAEIGTRYADNDPDGTQGYDGQFAYYIAVEPDPEIVASRLDVPAYRYQRILLPALARTLALGQERWIPWALLGINLGAHVGGTWLLVDHLSRRQRSAHYALIYALWAGLLGGVGLHLHEPLAYALVAAAWFARLKRSWALGAVLLGLSLFAKETTIFFWAAALVVDLIRRRWWSSGWLCAGGLAYGLWQLYLWRAFGSPGIGSGGDMATPFELVPFIGLAKVGMVNLRLFGVYALLFGPGIVLPCLWGLYAGGKAIMRGELDADGLALAFNAAVIPFLPFSTFREPLGLIRVATGLMLALVYFAAHRRGQRVLNYAMFWAVYLAFLVERSAAGADGG